MKKMNKVVILLLIYNQLALLVYCFQTKFHHISLLLFILNAICNNIMIYIYYKQENKKQLIKELEEIEFQFAQDQIYYQELDRKREDIAKMRHEYTNFISAILGLLYLEKELEAKEFLDEVIEQMESSNVRFR